MGSYYKELRSLVDATSPSLDTAGLGAALDGFAQRARELGTVQQQALADADSRLLSVINKKFRAFQRGFVSQGGLPEREFYKHVVFAPGSDTGKREADTAMPSRSPSFRLRLLADAFSLDRLRARHVPWHYRGAAGRQHDARRRVGEENGRRRPGRCRHPQAIEQGIMPHRPLGFSLGK